MSANDRKTKRKHERAILALLTEPTIVKAAEAIGVNEVTVRRWLRDPVFVTAYQEASRGVLDTAVGQLQGACGEAVQALQDVMRDSDAPAGSRVSAARTVLELSLKAMELHDLEARIVVLEERLNIRRAA